MSETITKIGMKPSHPGAFINMEILKPLGLTVKGAAEALGVGRQALSDLINGHSSLSPEMALRLEKAFNLNMDSMLRMQALYDSSQMREMAGDIDVKPFDPG